MPFVGNPMRIGQLARNIQTLADVPARASRAAAAAIKRLLLESFDAQSNPYGSRWAPYTDGSKRRGRRLPLLRETNNIRNSLDVLPMAGSGIRIQFDNASRGKGGSTNYLRYHQWGTKWMEPRMVLPDNRFPAAWRKAIDAAVREAYKR